MEQLLAHITIGLMIILIGYSLYRRYTKVIEGATGSQDKPKYQDPNLNQDPLYLATINASNITFLKSQIDDITKLRQQMNLLNEKVENNSTQLASINKSLQNTGTSSIPSKEKTNEMAASGNSAQMPDGSA